MEAKLIPIVGLDDLEEVRLSPAQPLVIGRGEDCSVRVVHTKVSRSHCRIAFENGFYSVEDLDSKNGTWVNNRRIHKAILFHHDRVTIGGAEFRFVLEEGVGEESSQVVLMRNSDAAFEIEIREPANAHTPSSLFLEVPKAARAQTTEDDASLDKELSVVCRIINIVNAEPNLDRLLDTIMDSVMEVTGADRGYLIAAKKLGGVLMPLVSRNKDGIPTFARNTFSRSIVSECYDSGYSILRSDPSSAYDASESMLMQQIQSIMCVPMRDEHGCIGVIYVDNVLGSRQFTKRDLKLLAAIANQSGIAIRRTQMARQVEGLFRDAMRTVINLVEVKDEYTYSHSERVTAVALRLAERCPDPRPNLREVEIAGLLHDVGKLAIRLDILHKPESLTASEYQAIQQHPASGATILKNVDNADAIADAIRHHHERWDGKGYPDGLQGDDIPLLARLLAIADAFDSMASERPYKKVLPEDEILAELRRGSGTQFDPVLVTRFVYALENDDAFRQRLNAVYRRAGTTTAVKGPFD